MRRPSIVRWSVVALACLLAGCGTTRKSGPFGWAGFGPEKSPAVAQRNPLREADEPSDAEPPAGAARARVGDEPLGTAAGGGVPNPETLALLARELRDATPEERQEFAGLATQDPDLVEQILRSRRLRLLREQEAAGDVRLASATDEDAWAHPTPAGDLPPGPSPAELGAELRVSGGSGLGHANPWARQNPAVLDPHLQPLPGLVQPAGSPRNFADDGFGHSTSYGSGVGPGGFGGESRSSPPRAQPQPGQGVPDIARREPVPAPSIAGASDAEGGPRSNPQVRAIESDGFSAAGSASPTSGGALLADEFLPISEPAGGNGQVDLQRLIAQAESQVAAAAPGTTDAERNEYVRRHVHLRLLYLMAGQQGRAMVAIPNIEPSDQEFWMQAFWALNNYFDQSGIPDRQDRAGQTVAQLRTAIRKLQEQARLDLRNVTFCHKISSYGNYERFDRDEFNPGQPVLVYAEVGNFTSEATADGLYRTMLKSTIEVYKAGRDGDLVERLTFPATEDLCRNHRQDYFHSYEFTIPPRASLGPHVLKLTVEDQLSRKLATYSVNFTVR
ncbi:MAG: hypothetical protein WED34_05585 [Planctomycetales bacterium]